MKMGNIVVSAVTKCCLIRQISLIAIVAGHLLMTVSKALSLTLKTIATGCKELRLSAVDVTRIWVMYLTMAQLKLVSATVLIRSRFHLKSEKSELLINI